MKPANSSLTSDKQPHLRVGLKAATRQEFAAAVTERLGKQRVSIMLDAAVIEFFKAKAGVRGYQTLINQALHQSMSGEQLEAVLRRVIREELHHA
jgi:uncharacterized protein (DUF4415 family)